MATRTKRTSSVRRETVSTPVTQQTSTSFWSSGSGRPSSPTMISRTQEKEELVGLNDRLAAYIDRVRSLETENSRLSKQIQTSEETIHRETSNVKNLYERELSDARKLLDDTSREKAKLQLEVNKYKNDYEELKEKYTQQGKDLAQAQKQLLSAESQVNDLQARLNDAVTHRKHWEDEYNKLKKDFDKVSKQMEAAKKQLEEEMVTRVDLENRLQSIREELQFKSTVHAQELNETISRTRVEIEEVDGKLQKDYDSKLAQELMAMREANDETIRSTREETEEVFIKKLGDLRTLAEANDGQAARALKEVSGYRKRISEMSSELSKLQSQVASQECRIKDLEKQLEIEQDDHKKNVETRDTRIRDLRKSLEDQLSEYRDLLDVKIQLDLEIAAYRKMLEGEESRLNLSSCSEATPSKTGQRRTPLRSTPVSRKRRRMGMEMAGTSFGGKQVTEMSKQSKSGYESSSSAKACVEVYEVDTDGKFIKLFNSSADKDQPIGGWILKLEGGDLETTYKFHRSSQIKAGGYVTVWSADSEQTHQPPSDLVMKGQKWFTADNMQATVNSTQGEEMASRKLQRSSLRTSYERSRDETDSGEENGDSGRGWFFWRN